jgi:hypothetical protein
VAAGVGLHGAKAARAETLAVIARASGRFWYGWMKCGW